MFFLLLQVFESFPDDELELKSDDDVLFDPSLDFETSSIELNA